MNNQRLSLLGCGLAILFALFFGCGERTGEKEYQKAILSWKKGELSRAQGQMEKALRKLTDPERKSIASNELGLILWALEKYDQAAERFAESCSLSSQLTTANLNLGAAHYRTGRLDEADFQLTTLRAEQPHNALAHTLSGLVCLQRRDWRQASEHLSEGLRLNVADPAAHNALALAQLHSDSHSDKAIERLKNVVNAYPDYAPALYNLAVIHDQWLRNKDEATSWYQRYLQHEHAQPEQIAAAQQAIDQLQGTAPSFGSNSPAAMANTYLAEGSQLHKNKKYKEAIARYQLAIKADPNSKNAYYNMGLSLYALERFDDARRAYVDALRIDSRDVNARYMLSLAYSKLGQWAEAEREARELKKLDPQRGEQLMDYIAKNRR